MLGGGGGGVEGGDSASTAAPFGAAAEDLPRPGSSNSEEKSSNRGGGEEGAAATEDSHHGGGGGIRWPRHETLELLRIRSEMDSIFRDSTPKAPLWEEVSRKLAELGYKRSAKKCKEKFENVYKYHKRTKDGRTAKHDGKTYRFFQELEAFDGQAQAAVQSKQPLRLLPPPPPAAATAVVSPALPWGAANSHQHQIMGTIPSSGVNGTSTTTTTSINFTITPPQHHHHQTHLSPTAVTPAEPISSSQPLNPSPQSVFHPSYHHHHQRRRHAGSGAAHLFSSSTSSSTASDEEMEEAGTKKARKRKRKLKDFFHKLTKDVVRKQEELQKKFLETVEKLDRERLDREGAWRVQEMARINREHEILIQERSTAAAKDAAVLALLQKVSGGGGVGGTQNVLPQLSLPFTPPLQPTHSVVITTSYPAPAPAATPTPTVVPTSYATSVTTQAHWPVSATEVGGRIETNGEAAMPLTTTTTTATSSRWPKMEVHALIGLRTRLDEKYQENGPKGPLWEEISSEMKKLGYNRNPKRCKEKWENINKYFKKVKESNRKRPEDSKTCPYFHQLDALYREKSIVMSPPTINPPSTSGATNYIAANPISAVEPAHHWLSQAPPAPHPPPPPPPPSHNAEEDEEDEEDEDDYEDDETDEEDDGRGGVGGFEFVQNKPSAMAIGGNGM